MSEKPASSRPGEFSLIERYFAPLATSAGAALLQDDAAVFAPDTGCELVVTKDMLMAGVHFFDNDPPFAVAQKALGVNLSDLAAKGAIPKGYLLGLGISNDIGEEWIAEFCRGLKSVQADTALICWAVIQFPAPKDRCCPSRLSGMCPSAASFVAIPLLLALSFM